MPPSPSFNVPKSIDYAYIMYKEHKMVVSCLIGLHLKFWGIAECTWKWLFITFLFRPAHQNYFFLTKYGCKSNFKKKYLIVYIWYGKWRTDQRNLQQNREATKNLMIYLDENNLFERPSKIFSEIICSLSIEFL